MKTNRKVVFGTTLLLITAILWGSTFIVQKLGSDHVNAFTFNSYRSLISAVVLFIIYFIIRFINRKNPEFSPISPDETMSKKRIIISMIFVGVGLFLGQTLQQTGLTLTKSASKSGFISSTYIIFVPIIGIFFHKKVRPFTWICLIIALTGSFLIAIKDGFEIEIGDLLTLGSAIGFAIQIIFVDEISNRANPILVSAVQFLISAVLSFICKVIFEGFDYPSFVEAIPAIVYAAIVSGCIAFTLQIVGQKYAPPTIASVTMSSECVFALIFSLIFLHEHLLLLEWIGCGLIMIAIILVQFNFQSHTIVPNLQEENK